MQHLLVNQSPLAWLHAIGTPARSRTGDGHRGMGVEIAYQ